MGGLLGKVQAERCQDGDSRSDIVPQKAWTGQDVLSSQDSGRRLSLRMYALRTTWSQDLTRSRMAFPKENDSHGQDYLFCFSFQILQLHGGYPRRSPVWILPEGETPVPGQSCTSTTRARSSHTSVAFSRRNRWLETVPAKERKTQGLTLPQQPLHWTWATRSKNEEVLRNRSLSLPIHKKDLHLKWTQRSSHEFFWPQLRTSNFAWKLAQEVNTPLWK